MSDASNLGYGNIYPNSNVNNALVNVTATNNPMGFSSTESGLAASAGHGMMGATNNAAAAAGCLGGLCNMTTMQMKGGRHRKSVHNKYMRLRHRSHRRSRSRSRSRSRYHHSRARTMNRKLALYNRRMASLSRKLMRSQSRRGGAMPSLSPAPFGTQKGGYHQYMGNVPNTPSYSVAGTTLGAANSALANPAPISTLSNCTNCVDNYSHYPTPGHPNGSGFQLWN